MDFLTNNNTEIRENNTLISCYITKIDVSDLALKHTGLGIGNELVRQAIASLAKEIIFKNRQGEVFALDQKYNKYNSIELTILSQTAYGFREWGITISDNMAIIHHYLEHHDQKRFTRKQEELNINTAHQISFNTDINLL